MEISLAYVKRACANSRNILDPFLSYASRYLAGASPLHHICSILANSREIVQDLLNHGGHGDKPPASLGVTLLGELADPIDGRVKATWASPRASNVFPCLLT